MREFETGATRDSEEGKPDFDGYLSLEFLEAYGLYMLKHQKQADGRMRESDNWKKGMGFATFMKSMWRHFFAIWKLHHGGVVYDERDGHRVDMIEALCALFFNVQGYGHEWLKMQKKETSYEAVKRLVEENKNLGVPFGGYYNWGSPK